VRDFLNDELVPATIALLLVGAFTYLMVTGKGPAPELRDLVLIILGFYFGSKGVQLGQRAATAARVAEHVINGVPSNGPSSTETNGGPPRP